MCNLNTFTEPLDFVDSQDFVDYQLWSPFYLLSGGPSFVDYIATTHDPLLSEVDATLAKIPNDRHGR